MSASQPLLRNLWSIIARVSASLRGGWPAAFAASTLVGEVNLDADGIAEGYSLAATYANGPLYFGVAHEVMGWEFEGTLDRNPADFEKWRVGLGIRDLARFSVSALYEDQKSINAIEKRSDKNNDADMWQGQIGYIFGNNMVKAMYGQKNHKVDVDEYTDLKSWAVGFDHKLSPRTKAYALYTHVDAGGSEQSLNFSR